MMWKVLRRGFASRVVSPYLGGYLRVSEEVQEALHRGQGVVALESTIITHGMPYPHNLSTALSVEKQVRHSGSVPATIAVLDGQIRVGLNEQELHMLAEENSQLVKISRRDLSYVLSHKLNGGTTVSGTMIAAHLAGISVFATGGIGGVHRGAETSFDVSADLTELGRTPVAVVSSGVKSILDIPKTLEYLETQGVFVSTFGESRDFPAFFTPRSGSLAPYNTPTVYDAAQAIHTQLSIGLSSGMLFAVPIPEAFSASGATIENAVNIAVSEARKQNVTGKAVTPFILDKVNQLTSGDSLQANISLVENNAKVAGGIAHNLALIRQGLLREDSLNDPHIKAFSTSPSPPLESCSRSSEEAWFGRPIVIGASVIDLLVQVKEEQFQMDGATYTGKVMQSFGGVGRNLADCLSRMEAKPVFFSAVGNDAHSASLFTNCQHMDLSAVQKLKSASTATYSPVLDSAGHVMFGVGDMDINMLFDSTKISHLESTLKQAPMVILDGNYSSHVIGRVMDVCSTAKVPVWYEPTDIHKAALPFDTDAWRQMTLISPNLAELRVMWKALMKQLCKRQEMEIPDHITPEASKNTSELVNEALILCRDLVPWVPVIVVTLGRHGALVCHAYGSAGSHFGLQELKQRPESSSFHALYYPAVTGNMEEPIISSVSGAGDCLCGAVVAGILQGRSLAVSMKLGLLAASLSLDSNHTVPDSINPVSVSQEVAEGWGWHDGYDVTLGWPSKGIEDGS